MCTVKEYMEWLDELYHDGYALLLRNGDPVAFCVGYEEWARERCDEYEDLEDCD